MSADPKNNKFAFEAVFMDYECRISAGKGLHSLYSFLYSFLHSFLHS
jgi:hypothetical protein